MFQFRLYKNIPFVIMFLVLVSCVGDQKMTLYEDNSLGFAMTYPSSWELTRNERLLGEVILEKDPSLFDSGSVRLAFDFRNSMGNDDYSPDSVVKTMRHTVSGIEESYGADLMDVITLPYTLEEVDSFTITKSVFSRDTSTFPTGSPQNRTGATDSSQDQIIALYWLTNVETEELVTITVYYGPDEMVNYQADQVIKSIRSFNEETGS